MTHLTVSDQISKILINSFVVEEINMMIHYLRGIGFIQSFYLNMTRRSISKHKIGQCSSQQQIINFKVICVII